MKTSIAMPHRAFQRYTPVALAIAAVLGTTQTVAQDVAIEEMIVTATRRAQSVLEVPYNISAISGAAIESHQITDNADLMRNVTGVSVVDRGHRNSGVINGLIIRGLTTDGAALGDYQLSAAPPVSSYVNDTPMYANFILRDIERVEVLRGPQGTLYGSGSLGGTVRYVMRAPQLGNYDANVSLTGTQTDGSDSMGWSGDAMLNIPMGDTLALRLNGSIIDQPGIIDYVNLYVLDDEGFPIAPDGLGSPNTQYRSKKDADTVEITYGRASLLWAPTDGFDLTLSHIVQSDKIGGRRQQTVGRDGFDRRYGKYENGSIQLEPAERDVSVSSLEMNVDLGFATLTSSTSHFDHKGESVSENTGFYAQMGFLPYYNNYPRPMASAVREFSDKGLVQELRLVSKSGGKLDYVAGLYYADQKMGSTQQSFLRGFKRWWDGTGKNPAAVTGDVDFDYARREKFEDKAVFGELTWHFTDKFQVTGGARYFDNTFRNDTYMALPLWAGLADPETPTFETSDSDVLFKLNASWRFAGQNTAYATISEGYRRGGSNAVPLDGFFEEDAAWQRYGSDSVVNYEIGVKGATSRMQYSAAVFYVDWKDVQINTATWNWGFYAAQNGGKARSAGVELDLAGQLTKRLSYTFGYAYTKAELTEDVFRVDQPALRLAKEGTRLPGTPEHAATASLEYTIPLSANSDWIFRFNGYYQSETTNAINTSALYNANLDAFQLLGASTTYWTKQWDATLYVKNITNEEGVTGMFKEEYMGTAPDQGYFGNGSKQFLSLPRTIGLQANYRF